MSTLHLSSHITTITVICYIYIWAIFWVNAYGQVGRRGWCKVFIRDKDNKQKALQFSTFMSFLLFFCNVGHLRTEAYSTVLSRSVEELCENNSRKGGLKKLNKLPIYINSKCCSTRYNMQPVYLPHQNYIPHFLSPFHNCLNWYLTLISSTNLSRSKMFTASWYSWLEEMVQSQSNKLSNTVYLCHKLLWSFWLHL